ncbi:hypothetical protein [Halobacterium bonnevillei]|uniref:Uncharacterized protein n=1 Tax=Halobacterium bonnevillei TaxID=2692200 RepID=A0A6B0SKI0_9EURY|nr:hypothetical protein [Halobacterium bonnevillei]MXR22218.1 hypothetical protein [Halobacterium bonnevillei]
MVSRNAVANTGWLPVVALLVLLWAIVTAVNVVGQMQAYAGGDYVGQPFVSGAVGLLVLLGFGVAVAYAYSEMGRSEPAPESFPPE